jgi:hypothetical protein
MLNKLKSRWYALIALSFAFVFGCLTFAYTTQMAITKDAAQNVRAAYHLVHTRVMGKNKVETKTPTPQIRREPLPILGTTGFLLLHPAFDQPYSIADLTDGRLTKTVKQVNAFWRFLAAVFVFLLCVELFRNRRVAAAMALICLIVSEFLFFARRGIVDRMYTELPEVAFMLLAAWCAVRFVKSKTKLRALWFGIALGALALTKASFLYIGVGFIALLFVADALNHSLNARNEPSWRTLLSTYPVIALAMFATVLPWIGRNTILFNKPVIVSGTDVSVLAIRLLLMEQPLSGQLYLYSPTLLKKLAGPLTGYDKADLEPEGRLYQFETLKADREIMFERMRADNIRSDKNEWIKDKVLSYVTENPLRYLGSVGVFAYKGMWFMTQAGSLFNLVALLCFFGVFFGALFTRNQVLIAAFGLPSGLFFFISIFTHALTRYTAPMTPFVVISVLWLIGALARKSYRRSPWLRNLIGRCARRFQPASEAKSSSQRRPTVSTSSAETASHA